MKEIVIIADLHHASPRMVLMSKYLKRKGIDPIIITPPLSRKTSHIGIPEGSFLDMLSIVETNAKGTPKEATSALKQRVEARGWKLYKALKPILQFLHKLYLEARDFPDTQKAWKKEAIGTFEKIFQKHEVVALLSSSSPATCHVVANELSRRHGLPWIADLRDLWSQNHNYQHSKVRYLVERAFERKVLQRASCIVTVTPDWAERLKILHRRSDVLSITNGYDPETVAVPAPHRPVEALRLVYTGQIYPQKQDVGMVLDALTLLIEKRVLKRNRVRFDFYGRYSEELQSQVTSRGLDEVVAQNDPVPWNKVQEVQAGADILVLFYWSDTSEKGWIPSKVFEYFAAGKPILATGSSSDNIISRMLAETRTGSFCLSADEAAAAIEIIYRRNRHNSSEGQTKLAGESSAIERYSWDYLATQYLQAIERATEAVRSRKGKVE